MVFCLLLFSIPMTLLADKSTISHQTQEVQNQLKHLNRLAESSIKSLDGDIIDCVNIKHQPAFDHPLLKNHTIQTPPSFHLRELSLHETKAFSNVESITQLWHLNGSCPVGTIPIRRVKESDILRASSIEGYGRKEQIAIHQPSSANLNVKRQIGRVRASAAMKPGESIYDKYSGGGAAISVWEPRVERDGESSSSQIWISRGNETVEAGWQVNPSLYGDSKPRLFGYWTNAGDQSTGCYNLLCSGFIQTDNKIALGATLSPISTYDGDQYDINIAIKRVLIDGSWWLYFAGREIGYWPGSLFPNLQNGALSLEWGGEVGFLTSNATHTATEMGSGHFPREGPRKASFFRNLKYADKTTNGVLTDPASDYIVTSPDQSNCYDIQKGESKDWTNYFFYGGPGRNPECP